MLSDRQKQFLEIIIREYIKRAEPVSSALVLEKSNLDLSSATVRNELMILEAEGYVFQPHTSAGRVPTDLAYQLFLQEFFKNKKIKEANIDKLKELKLGDFADERSWRKAQAKQLAEITGETVMLAFDSLDLFYTGISNLFTKPEFQNDYRLIENLSNLIDHLDEVLAKVFYQVDDEVKIYLGDNNPFHRDCAVILSRYENPEGSAVIGILGPRRMDYERNIALLLAFKTLHKLNN